MQAQESRNARFLRQSPPVSALGLGLIAAFCWGIHDITIRYLSRSVHLLAALLTVLIVGALFQTAVILISGVSLVLDGKAIALSLAAGLAFLVASLGLYYAFERGPVRVVAPVIASFPILSMGFALLSGAQITLLQGLAVLAIVIGVGLVAALSDEIGSDAPPLGPTLALSLLSAAGFASTFKLGQMAADISGELPSTLLTRLTALSALLVVMALRKAPFFPGTPALVPLTIMGLLDGIALLAVISAAPLPNPEYAAVASSVFGLLTIVLAWAFLRERMSLGQWGACLITFTGIGYLAL